MISLKTLMIRNIARILVVAFCFLPNVLPLPRKKMVAFSGSGPYDHTRITRLALERFAERTGLAVRADCSQMLIHGSVISDSERTAYIEELHCDNNIMRCAKKLHELKHLAIHEPDPPRFYYHAGQALHLVQDFYSHTNWAETFRFTYLLAPIESFKDLPPPEDLQTGVFPDPLQINYEAAFRCLLVPEDKWNRFIPGATHGCLNKDTNRSVRGMRAVQDGFGMTYHELAAEYAIRHSVDLLEHLRSHSIVMNTCLIPDKLSLGCNQSINELLQ